MATAETPPSKPIPGLIANPKLQMHGPETALDVTVPLSSSSDPSGLEVDAYEFLKSLHRNHAGSFTHYHELDGVVLGLQTYEPESPLKNNLLASHVKHLAPVIGQAEHILESQGSVPAVYFPEGDHSEELRDYLIGRGYGPDPEWTDAWMFGDLETVQAKISEQKSRLPDTVGIKAGVATKHDWFTYLGVLRESRATPKGRNNPYGELDLESEEHKAISASVWRVLEDDSRGRCVMVERRSPPDKRRWASVAAVAMVSYIDGFFGRVAHIENVARRPLKTYGGLGRTALLAAAEAGLDFLARDAPPFVGPTRIVSLATEPNQGPYKAFQQAGFVPAFEAYGYVKR